MTRLPSIRRRLGGALLRSSLAWGLAMAAAVWLAVQHEVDELLDETLQAAAEVLAVVANNPAAVPSSVQTGGFVWQLVGPRGEVLQRSPAAPSTPLVATPASGVTDVPDWHVYGRALRGDGTMLYVAQTRAERREAQVEVALSTVLAALAIGWLGHLWLRARVGVELAPLQRLSERLSRFEPLDPGASLGFSLGIAEREELQPVQAAIDDLAARLAQRVIHERAFSAHAAHALRTPLAGIDAQLAMALRESPAALQPRLQRARDAAGRLQRVVAALLALFRTGGQLRREPVDVSMLVSRLPIERLGVHVQGGPRVHADADLLAAAMLNLLDNALRHGAHTVTVDMPRAGTVRVHDDGPGVPAERRQALRAALHEQRYAGAMGLGLMLADLVARSHGGRLALPDVDAGFAADIELGA